MLAGATAMGYHSLPKGRLRSGLRKLDHWTISLATSAMVPAILPTVSPVSANAASLLQNGAQIGQSASPCFLGAFPAHEAHGIIESAHAERIAVTKVTLSIRSIK